MNLIKQTKTYYYEKGEMELSSEREVIIGFIKDENISRYWKFNDAEFKGVEKGHYTLDDWRFLGKVADKIEELLKNLNK